jgi:hypothetical protein
MRHPSISCDAAGAKTMLAPEPRQGTLLDGDFPRLWLGGWHRALRCSERSTRTTLLATGGGLSTILLLHLFDIDHLRLTHRFQGRDFRLTDVGGKVIDRWLA